MQICMALFIYMFIHITFLYYVVSVMSFMSVMSFLSVMLFISFKAKEGLRRASLSLEQERASRRLGALLRSLRRGICDTVKALMDTKWLNDLNWLDRFEFELVH